MLHSRKAWWCAMLVEVGFLGGGCEAMPDPRVEGTERARGGIVQALAARSSLTIAQAGAPPQIDGQLDALWRTAEPHAIARPLLGSLPGLPNASAHFRALWDAQHLYLFVDVNDDVRVREQAAPWEDDAVEVYLDGNAAGGDHYDADDYQYVFRVRDPQTHVGARSAPADRGVRATFVETGGGYRLETAIPWAGLGGAPSVGRRIGLDVHVDDDDDGGARDRKIAWAAAADDAWERPSALLPLVLEATPPPELLTLVPSAMALPLLDGRRDESFLRSPAHPIARAIRGSAPARADLTAAWRALYDGAFLYVVVEVEDDRVVVDSSSTTPWEDDAVELYVDANASGGSSYDGVDDVHLVVRPGRRDVHLGLRSAPVRPSDIAAVATTWNATGYVLEVYVPWSAIPSAFAAGKTLRMEVQVDDDDDGGGRDTKLAWWSGDDEAWQHPDRFGRVRLSSTRVGENDESASFEGLGDLSGGARASVVHAMDRWGNVVVGTSEGARGQQAVRWTRAWGLHALGDAPSAAYGVSPDGSYIVGTGAGAPEGALALWRGSLLSAFRKATETVPGGPPMFALTLPRVVLDDATVYASCIQYAAYGERLGCRVDPAGQVVLRLPTSEFFAASPGGSLAGMRQARREPIGSIAMLDGREIGYPGDVRCIIPHACRSELRDLTDDATLGVGKARVPLPGAGSDADADEAAMHDTAFVYTASAGMTRLPDLEGGAYASGALTVSADGSLIAGYGTDEAQQHAVVWSERMPRMLRDVAEADGASIPEGWRLLEVVAMSADGRILTGNGVNPAGAPEGFRITLRARP